MKKVNLIILLLFLLNSLSLAQFREEIENPVSIREGIFNNQPSGFLSNFFSPENFKMKHTVSMSYASGGGEGIALGIYTNSMFLKLSSKLNLRVDASLINTPYNTFGDRFSTDINGLYLSGAELEYKISDKSNIKLIYRRVPYTGYNYYYSPFDLDYRSNFK